LPTNVGGRTGGTIPKINSAGIITTVTGGGIMAFESRLFATTVQETSLDGVAADNLGNFFYAEGGGHNVVRVNSGGLATSLTNQTGSPADLAADRTGNVYVADHDNSRIVKLDQSGKLSVVVSMWFGERRGGQSRQSVPGRSRQRQGAEGGHFWHPHHYCGWWHQRRARGRTGHDRVT
jgi:hypothetical protein